MTTSSLKSTKWFHSHLLCVVLFPTHHNYFTSLTLTKSSIFGASAIFCSLSLSCFVSVLQCPPLSSGFVSVPIRWKDRPDTLKRRLSRTHTVTHFHSVKVLMKLDILTLAVTVSTLLYLHSTCFKSSASPLPLLPLCSSLCVCLSVFLFVAHHARQALGGSLHPLRPFQSNQQIWICPLNLSAFQQIVQDKHVTVDLLPVCSV